jgi:hypothetical protein
VGLSLRHLMLLLAAAIAVSLVRELRRWRRRIRPRFPELTKEEALEIWRRESRPDPDAVLLPDASAAGSSKAAWEAAARAALEAEEWSRQFPDARRAIRQAILAQAVLALKLEAILGRDEAARRALVFGYRPGMDELLAGGAAACHLTWRLLRHYARLKFDDAVPDDWFHRFVRLARPYIREKVRLAEAAVVSMDEGARRFAAVYDLLLEELQRQALAAPPKQRFARPDLPGA